MEIERPDVTARIQERGKESHVIIEREEAVGGEVDSVDGGAVENVLY